MKVEMNKETEMLGRNEVQEMEDSINQLKSSIKNSTKALRGVQDIIGAQR